MSAILQMTISNSFFCMKIDQAGKLALANASEYLAGRVENRFGGVEFCIGYKSIRDYPVRASAKNFYFPSLLMCFD